jgi:hypothetical protein
MIDATYSVLAACTGSTQSLSRSLSPVDRLPGESSHRTRRPRLFSRWKSLIRLPSCPLLPRIRLRDQQNVIQYPEARSGSVQ